MPPVHKISTSGNCSNCESILVNGEILINWNDNDDSSWLVVFSVIPTTTHAFVKH